MMKNALDVAFADDAVKERILGSWYSTVRLMEI